LARIHQNGNRLQNEAAGRRRFRDHAAMLCRPASSAFDSTTPRHVGI